MDLGQRVERAWRSFRESLLFFPTLMSIAALALFAGTSVADGNNALERTLEQWSGTPVGFLVFAGGPEAAISLLSAIVGTWATIVGVVYSIVLVTLQLSATKYSAQVIPVFERDKLNQIVLGTFTATFVYSLLVLKTVRVADGDPYVPLLGTNVAVILALTSLFMLIALIGNLTAYIRPTRFVDDYARSGVRSLAKKSGPVDTKGFRLLEGDKARRALEATGGEGEGAENCSVNSDTDGYVTTISWRRVRDALTQAPGEVRKAMVRAPVAAHVGEEEALLTCQNVGSIDPATQRRLRRAFELGASAKGGDPKHVLDTLADIGVTALSGGATDVGVAKSALQGILRVTTASFERVDDGRVWAIEAEGREIVLTLEQERFYEAGFLAARRILHKASIEEYWDVSEAFTQHVAPVLRNAADRRDDRVWNDLLEWLRPIAQDIFEYDDAQARIRMVRHLRAATAELREGDHDEKALDVEFILLQAARDAGVADEVRTAIAGHGDE